MIFVNKRTTAD
jgi:ATP-dependent RNA helicase DDX19/DBP5